MSPTIKWVQNSVSEKLFRVVFATFFICFIFVDREKEKSKNRGKKEGPSSISGEQLPFTTGLHRQPLLFLFPFPFFFVFCILHHCSLCMWTVESSSPPASAVSTASHCFSSSPSPSSSSSAFSTTVHFACEQWRAAHHQPPPFPPPATALLLPLPLLLHLLHSPFVLQVNNGEQLTTGLRCFHRQPLLFSFSFSFVFCILHCSRCMWIVESISTVHGRTGSDPNLNALDRVRPSKIKKIQKNFTDIVFYLKN